MAGELDPLIHCQSQRQFLTFEQFGISTETCSSSLENFNVSCVTIKKLTMRIDICDAIICTLSNNFSKGYKF